jgi:glycosyltransferase involved in cell wall biosynthesis
LENKPIIIAFSQHKIGGVQSYYYNLLSRDRWNDFEKVWIFSDFFEGKDAKPRQPYACCKEIVFTYGSKPFYKSLEDLAALIPEGPGLLLANHSLELAAVHKHSKRDKTVVFVCHDEMYIHNAVRYEFMIDVYIAHNLAFYKLLKEKLPPERRGDVYYLPYGISPAPTGRSRRQPGEKLRVLFIARLTREKGIYDLAKIDDELVRHGFGVEWTIVGDGPEKENLKASLSDRGNFSFCSPPTNQEILDIAVRNDVYVLPSYLDGMPVALLEAMSAGLVPILYRFNEGIEGVLTPDTGFIVSSGDYEEVARKIAWLDKNRDHLETMSSAARSRILNEFEVGMRSEKYYDLFKKFRSLKKPLRSKHIQYDGRLDYPFIPQSVRDGWRSLRKILIPSRKK